MGRMTQHIINVKDMRQRPLRTEYNHFALIKGIRYNCCMGFYKTKILFKLSNVSNPNDNFQEEVLCRDILNARAMPRENGLVEVRLFSQKRNKRLVIAPQ